MIVIIDVIHYLLKIHSNIFGLIHTIFKYINWLVIIPVFLNALPFNIANTSSICLLLARHSNVSCISWAIRWAHTASNVMEIFLAFRINNSSIFLTSKCWVIFQTSFRGFIKIHGITEFPRITCASTIWRRFSTFKSIISEIIRTILWAYATEIIMITRFAHRIPNEPPFLTLTVSFIFTSLLTFHPASTFSTFLNGIIDFQDKCFESLNSFEIEFKLESSLHICNHLFGLS